MGISLWRWRQTNILLQEWDTEAHPECCSYMNTTLSLVCPLLMYDRLCWHVRQAKRIRYRWRLSNKSPISLDLTTFCVGRRAVRNWMIHISKFVGLLGYRLGCILIRRPLRELWVELKKLCVLLWFILIGEFRMAGKWGYGKECASSSDPGWFAKRGNG